MGAGGRILEREFSPRVNIKPSFNLSLILGFSKSYLRLKKGREESVNLA
jgi:hypothetical protein